MADFFEVTNWRVAIGRRNGALRVGVVGLFLAMVSWGGAADWPQYRGIHRDAVFNESGLLKSFPTNGLAVVWKHVVGPGWSSPVIAGGRVYVTDVVMEKPLAREQLHCLEEKTGRLLWKYVYETPYPEWAFVPAQLSPPTSTPICEGGRVYMIGANGYVHCLDGRTGHLIWENNLGTHHEIRELMCRASPLIYKDLLVVVTGGKPGAYVVALDKRTGKEVWQALDETVSNSSPLMVKAGRTEELILWTGSSVAAVNPKTGALYWREPMVTSSNDGNSMPVAQGKRVLLGGLMMEVDTKRPEGRVVWPEGKALSKRILSNTSTALWRGNFIYAARSGGEFVCLEARNGEQLWGTNVVTGAKNGASIHLTESPVGTFLFTDEGNLILAELRPEGYREISRAKVIEPTSGFGGKLVAWAAPSFANRQVYVRSDKEVVCWSLAARKGR